MSLADNLKAAPRLSGGTRCSTCSWLEDLDAADRKAFNDWVDSGQPISVLWRVIRDHHGYTACDSSLKYHIANHHGPRE